MRNDTVLNAFLDLNSEEMFFVEGGDPARQQMIAEHRASGESLGGSDREAIGAQATVTGWALALVGVAAAIPTGGASLVLAAVSLGVSTAGLMSL